jgi:tRNA dimethylallyltransferase
MSPNEAASDLRASERPPVVVVTGPTAAGKTELAIELALRFGGEIVNADSAQIYRFMDIGTAKPSLEQRARVPHHLIDILPPNASYSAGRYAIDGRRACAQIHARGRVVFLTGGTGLYIRALLHGVALGGAADPAIRERLEREQREAVAAGDPQRLFRRLEAVDPAAAARIHRNDLRRIVRALEIHEQQGLPASALQREHGFGEEPYRVLHLALDPGVAELDRRIALRCHAMIEAGLLREVRELRRRGFGPELRSMQAIGYRHLHAVAAGQGTLERAVEAMIRDTRAFARRQRTWLRSVRDVIWLDPRDTAEIERRVRDFVGEAATRIERSALHAV